MERLERIGGLLSSISLYLSLSLSLVRSACIFTKWEMGLSARGVGECYLLSSDWEDSGSSFIPSGGWGHYIYKSNCSYALQHRLLLVAHECTSTH